MKRPVRVLVNAVSAHTGGGLTYAFEQLRALSRVPGLELTVLASKALAENLEPASQGITIHTCPSRRLPHRIAWEQTAIPVLARRHDVVYGLGNFGLLVSPRPQVVVLQNPNHFGAAARHTRRRIASRRHRLRLVAESAAARLSARRAARAIAVSRTLRAAVEEDLGTLPGLRAVPSGVPELPEREGTGRRRHVLAVANDYPHKDWDSMIAAFADDERLPPLLLVGECRPGRRDRELHRLLSRLAPGRVSLVGPVADRRELARLYRDALCLVAHSRLEAFPLTPYEALSVGLPVAASDIAAHREACGTHAVYYDPDDTRSLGRAVRNAIGRRRAADAADLGSWTDNAAAVARILIEAAGPDA